MMGNPWYQQSDPEMRDRGGGPQRITDPTVLRRVDRWDLENKPEAVPTATEVVGVTRTNYILQGSVS